MLPRKAAVKEACSPEPPKDQSRILAHKIWVRHLRAASTRVPRVRNPKRSRAKLVSGWTRISKGRKACKNNNKKILHRFQIRSARRRAGETGLVSLDQARVLVAVQGTNRGWAAGNVIFHNTTRGQSSLPPFNFSRSDFQSLFYPPLVEPFPVGLSDGLEPS